MRTSHQIRKRIDLLRKPREGGLFSDEFEAGELLALLWVLGEEPRFETHEQVHAFISTRAGVE